MNRLLSLGRAAFTILLTSLASQALAQVSEQPRETLPGFKPNGVYESQGIEHLSVYNGDPQLAVPLGPEYPTGPGTSFRLYAHYSTRFWHLYEVACGTNEFCGTNTYTRAHVRGRSTLGVGWTLELGTIDPGSGTTVPARYLSPDGGVYEFNEPAEGVPTLTHDGPEVRIEKGPNGGYVVRQTDGTSLWLTHFYRRPSSRNELDFIDVGSNEIARLDRWGLDRIQDRFGNTVLTVSWMADDPANAWKISAIQLGSPGRTIHFGWGEYSQPNMTETWDVLSWIQFPILAAPTTSLTVSFGYEPSGLFQRTIFDSGWESECPSLGTRSLNLPFLASISQSTMEHGFELDYSLGDTGSGLLTSFRLPTGAVVGYGYSRLTALAPCFLRPTGCPSLEESSAPEPAGEPEEPICDQWSHTQRFLDQVPAVVTRTETDPITQLSAMTTYSRKQFAAAEGEDAPESGRRDPKRILRRVIVKRRSGNGEELVAARHLFHVIVSPAAGPGLEVERRTYAGPLATGPAVRSVVTCYDDVTFPPAYSTACGAVGADGTITTFDGFGQAPLSREVTWYGTNPVGGAECSDATAIQVACMVRQRSGWDPTAREFSQETIWAPRTGPSEILLQDGQLGRRTTTLWDPRSSPSSWQPKLFASRTREDLPNPGCPFAPCATTTTTSFNPVTGALDSSTVTGDGVSRTSALGYTNGNPTTETISGSGLTGTYVTTRGFQVGTGLVATAQRTAPSNPGWLQFDVTRDAALGLVTASRDPNGLPTSYSWDGLGRLTGVAPPAGEVPTSFCYGEWDGGTRGAWLLEKRGPPTACSTVAGIPAEGSETAGAFVYDGFGRPIREIRLLSNEVAPGTYMAVRTTERNTAGLVAAVSEWVPCGTGTDLSTCFVASAPSTSKTTLFNFDVFGRPRLIVLPDGTQVLKAVNARQTASRVE